MSAFGKSRWFSIRYLACCGSTWVPHVWVKDRWGREHCARCGRAFKDFV